VTVAEQINGGWYRAAKANSPYTGFGTTDGVVAKYGGQGITVDLKTLNAAIESGEVKGVEIMDHETLLKTLEDSNLPAHAKKMALSYARADKEILVKGVVPARLVRVEQ